MKGSNRLIGFNAQAEADIAKKRAKIYVAMRKVLLMNKVHHDYMEQYDDLELDLAAMDEIELGGQFKRMYKEIQDRLDHLEDLAHTIYTSQVDLNNAIDQYLGELSADSAPQCRFLCEHIQHKLPRGLRDMIFEYVLEPSTSDAISNNRVYYSAYITLQAESAVVNAPSLNQIQAFDTRTVMRICNTDFFGPASLCELAETYYRIHTFYLPNEKSRPRSAQHLTTFFEDRMWGLDLNVSNLVKNLEINSNVRIGRDYNERFLSPESMDVLLKLTTPINIKLCIDHELCRFVTGRSARARKLSVNFLDLDQLLQNDHRIIVDIGSNLSFQVKSEELTIEHWAKKL